MGLEHQNTTIYCAKNADANDVIIIPTMKPLSE